MARAPVAKAQSLVRQERARLTAIPTGSKARDSQRKGELTKLMRLAKKWGKAVSFPVPAGIKGHKSAISVLLYTLFNKENAIAGHRIKSISRNGRLVAWLVPAAAKSKRKRRATRQRSG